MLLYSRKKVRYRRDGYCWKKRKDGKTTREDHMKLKVQGTECIYGCYVHSAILPTFHRRCYWLLQNPDIVLVHYLNVPYPDDNKLAVITPSLSLWADKKEWTKEELISQLKPMFFSEEEPDLNNELEISTAETVETIVSQLMEKQRVARQAALVKQLECGCPDSTCADGKSCSHPMRRIGTPKNDVSSSLASSSSNSRPPSRADNNQVSSTTGTLLNNNHSNRVYPRDLRNHHVQGNNHATTNSNNPAPLVLSLSQIQNGGGLLILNSNSATNSSNNSHQSFIAPVSVSNYVSSTTAGRAQNRDRMNKTPSLVLKQEVMDSQLASAYLQQPNQNVAPTNNKRENKMDIRQSTVNDFSFNHQHQKQHDGHLNEMVMVSAPPTPSKRMDTSNEEVIDFKHQNFCDDSVVLLDTDSSGSLASKNEHSSVISGGFFNETLDLSQEDIQKTLSANMPLCSADLESHQNSCNTSSNRNRGINNKQSQQHHHHHDQSLATDINPMDFIDNCDVVSPTHVVDDDVFVNLDAFDMLGEFPEFDALDSGHNGLFEVNNPEEGRQEHSKQNESSQSQQNSRGESSAKITDYSPEWAYPEGGVKVLVTGPWHSSGPYTVLFDNFPVPTTLVQDGVLRCYCPAHEVGLATLQVACNGCVISNSVIFEYKLPSREEQVTLLEPKVEKSNDNLLKFTLLQRLEAMDDRLHIKQEPTDGSDHVEDTVLFMQPNFEDRLVSYCQTMTSRVWQYGEELSVSWFASHRGMTLLHLAASLGYSRLVCALLHWRAENSSLLLETEVDALSQDEDGNTPLMWACSKGHTETAVMLYRWNHTALNIKNSSLQTPLEVAKSNRHIALVKELEKLEARREKANLILHSSIASADNPSPPTISPASSITSIASAVSNSKSHDGVFLKPGIMTSSLMSDSNLQSRNSIGGGLVKRPSIDSGINMTSSDNSPLLRPKSTRSKECLKLTRFDRSMSLPICSPLSSQDGSYDNETLETSKSRKMDFALWEQDARVLTLAEQIIAAMPDRIKNDSEEMMLDSSPGPSEIMPTSETLSDVFMEPLLEQSNANFESTEFNFEFSDNNYRYYDVSTPCSSLSPASSSCLQSPRSFTLDSPSPPPTTADFCEFLQASGSVFEKDFSNLTLSDQEQRELYEAAKIIQKAYRSYKGRQQQEQDKERAAAVIIQNYYRRYKQYAYFKQMTHAAMVIQNGFRSYCEHKRFKRSQESLHNYYRNFKENEGKTNKDNTPASGIKRTYSQRRQNQAARKIQQFMRQSKNKLQRERAEREKQAGLSQDVHQKLLSPGVNSIIAQNNRSVESLERCGPKLVKK
ncbi:calmodulin-binding transcription activator 1 isoform X2 [Agrilus planipennis]|uniref:Calmodulin-binding transcription activator 1 isoform X2 n=1 Tax=Agrilus planipennis TaxID=224129 RepID=A0A1W4WEF5_AGRPL|nr:calmodulin-binding transcription activator 1 isoform X2 [Agrilus planipennis]